MASAASSSSSSPPSQFDDSAARRQLLQQQQQRKPPLLMLLPLIYAPVLPLIRIGLRHNPVWRDRLFYGVLAGAFAHGTYLISELYDVESKRKAGVLPFH
uniref:Uncharacterized protein n=1 Tax=Leersia perrieri TaxID=77586 RepID=A0A0D9WDD4_9ORYZ